jgi:hypothetical protein
MHLSNPFSILLPPTKKLLPCLFRMDRMEEAVSKLLKFVAESSVSGSDESTRTALSLFAPPSTAGQVRPIDAEVSFVTALRPHRVPLFVTLPHEVLNGSICVVTKPPQRTFKDLVIKAQEEEGNPVAQRIRKVIDVTKLDAKFKDPVALRALANSFDHFFVYKVARYPKALVGEFLHHQHTPVWAPKGPFLESMNLATRTAVVPRRGFDNVTVRIGHSGLSSQQLVENLKHFIQEMFNHPDGLTPQGLLQIRVAATNSENKRAALPVWSHDYDLSHPGVLSPSQAQVAPTPSKAARDEAHEEPSAKRRRKK